MVQNLHRLQFRTSAPVREDSTENDEIVSDEEKPFVKVVSVDTSITYLKSKGKWFIDYFL